MSDWIGAISFASSVLSIFGLFVFLRLRPDDSAQKRRAVMFSCVILVLSLGTYIWSLGKSAPLLPDKQQSSGEERVSVMTSSSACTGPGDASIQNNTHGTIQILSGTGIFSRISPTDKRVIVPAGSTLTGTVILRVLNQGPSFAVAPLIETSSWGTAETAWKTVNNLGTGISTITAQVDHRAPLQAGSYHIVFAFQLEMTGGNVASATNWSRRLDVWNDGNDLSQIGPDRVREAQKFGCTVNPWLTKSGFEQFYVPLDAITVEVARAN